MIRFEGIGHDYGKGTVLEGIDLDVERGHVSVVCGPNAAGKTTLLRISAGLLAPTQGRVLLEGVPSDSIRAGARARRLSFMSQRFECASGFSVRRVLELARVMVGRNAAALASVIDALELGDLLDRGLDELSSGQNQRVALARALAQAPPDGFIVLDEPLAALDPRWALVACQLLSARARAGAAVLLTVHELPAAARLADQVVLLGDGRLVASGTPVDVLAPDRLERAYGIRFELLEADDGSCVPVAAGSPRAGRM